MHRIYLLILIFFKIIFTLHFLIRIRNYITIIIENELFDQFIFFLLLKFINFKYKLSYGVSIELNTLYCFKL